MMKILFGIFVILSILVGMFTSVVFFASYGLGLADSAFGTVVCLAGMLAVIVSVVGVVLGISNLRKGKKKQATLFVLLGVLYSAVIFGGMGIDEAVDTAQMEKDIAQRMEETYGEGWNSPSAIEGIPELYEELLNKFYVVVRDEWPAENLMDLGVVSMPRHYGDAGLDNIGFALTDLNGDSVDELVIGTVTPAEGGTLIFCIYSDPENPHYYISAVEDREYYLHAGEDGGTYAVEIVGMDSAWSILPAEAENAFDFTDLEKTLDPAGRMTLELIPFSQYK